MGVDGSGWQFFGSQLTNPSVRRGCDRGETTTLLMEKHVSVVLPTHSSVMIDQF
jgi:hypothetical protein